MALNLTANLVVAAKMTGIQDLGGSVTAGLSRSYSATLTDGALAGQVNELWFDQRTLAASGTEDLDLAGALMDPLGGTAVFVRVKGLIVSAAAANTNNVVVGAAANAWAALLNSTGTVSLRPGATLAVFAGAADATGYVVTAGTGDLLKVANSAGSTGVTYDIIVFGANS